MWKCRHQKYIAVSVLRGLSVLKLNSCLHEQTLTHDDATSLKDKTTYQFGLGNFTLLSKIIYINFISEKNTATNMPSAESKQNITSYMFLFALVQQVFAPFFQIFLCTLYFVLHENFNVDLGSKTFLY